MFRYVTVDRIRATSPRSDESISVDSTLVPDQGLDEENQVGEHAQDSIELRRRAKL